MKSYDKPRTGQGINVNGIWSSGNWYSSFFAVIPYRNADKLTSITNISAIAFNGSSQIAVLGITVNTKGKDYIVFNGGANQNIGGCFTGITFDAS